MLYTGVLLISCFMWGGALDSFTIPLSHSVISLALHITTILISTLKHKQFLL